MELELKKELLRFYEFSTVSTTVHAGIHGNDRSGTTARISPGSSIRTGKVFLRSKDIQGDKAIVTGSVKVTVLFTSEEEDRHPQSGICASFQHVFIQSGI